MRTPAQADLQRWSDEVARDPRSLAFLPLARAYRRQGLHDTALQLCLRGLEAYPSHIEAHGLLALLYVERGAHEKAADEWSIVLRIDPDNFEALRGLGFCYLQQDRLSRARQMLERAALQRPADPAVNEALRLLGARSEPAPVARPEPPPAAPVETQAEVPGPAPSLDAPADDTAPADAPVDDGQAEPWSDSEGQAEEPTPAVRWHDDTPFDPASGADSAPWVPAEAGPLFWLADEQEVAQSATPEPQGVQPEPVPSAAASAEPAFGYSPMADPASLFEDLVGSGPVLGALVVDAHGLVLAGRMTDSQRDAAILGAVLGGTAFEAGRTAAHLSLGAWRGITMEAGDALLHIVPAGANAIVVLAARTNTPAGWMRRAAAQAADRAQLYLEAYG